VTSALRKALHRLQGPARAGREVGLRPVVAIAPPPEPTAPTGGDITTDPTTWPPELVAFWKRLAVKLAGELEVDLQEAEALARGFIAFGRVELPELEVEEREDGTFPEVGLPARVKWVFKRGKRE